ncbi:glycosyltransferase family 2 protein [Halocola ammonii]
MIIDVVIPAYNEEKSIGLVLGDIDSKIVRNVVVVNNNSSDGTAAEAEKAGATVLHEQMQGYGAACLRGISYVNQISPRADVLVFMDADYSDHPEELEKVVSPIKNRDIDFVIGSRALGNKEKGSMMPQQVFGNWLATKLIKLFYGVKFTDLGPFRAIKLKKLNELGMVDTNFGWTVEMQVKAAQQNLSFEEVPVKYRKRIGVSKVTGTLKGSILAGYKIIWTIFKYR